MFYIFSIPAYYLPGDYRTLRHEHIAAWWLGPEYTTAFWSLVHLFNHTMVPRRLQPPILYGLSSIVYPVSDSYRIRP